MDINSGRFTIYNGVSCNIHASIDMHSSTISNTRLSNIVAINGYMPYTGSFQVIHNFTANSGGGFSWTRGTIVVQDGLITSVS